MYRLGTQIEGTGWKLCYNRYCSEAGFTSARCRIFRPGRRGWPVPAPPLYELHAAVLQQPPDRVVADDKEVALVKLSGVPAPQRGVSEVGAASAGCSPSRQQRPAGQPDPAAPVLGRRRRRRKRAGRGSPALGGTSCPRGLNFETLDTPCAATHWSASTVIDPRSSSTRKNTCRPTSGSGIMSCARAAATGPGLHRPS